MDKPTRFTVLPFLVSFLIAVAGMPTNVIAINRAEMGHEHTQPWRSTSLDAISRTLSRLHTQVRHTLADLWRHPLRGPALAGAATVLAAAVLPDASTPELLLAIGPVAAIGLNDAREAVAAIDRRRAENDQRLADNAQRANEIDREIVAITDAVTKDKRAMTDKEQEKLADLRKQKVASNDIRAALLEQQADASKRQAEAKAELTQAEARNEAEKKATAVKDADADAAAKAGKIAVGKNLAEDDPKRGFKDHKEFLGAVMDAGRGRKVDARLIPLQAAQGSDEQGVYSDPHGGFLVPHGVAPGILSIAPESDPIEPMLTQVPMTAPTVSFNARVDKNHATSVSGGFIVTRRPETVDGTSSRGSFEQVTLTANEEFGLAFATERILTDSPQSFVAIIQAGFRDEYVANGMNERINGTGAGERQGALNALCKIEVVKETGQGAATIQKENIDKMAARCWRYSRAVWMANHNTRSQLKSLVQVVGTGGNAVAYFVTDGAPAGFDGLLDGRPLVFTEFAKTLGTAGDLILIVPSEYLEGTYQSEQYAESIHVRFASAERAFRFYRRNDGQWWWRTVLTPKNGSTLAPVVTLATRA